jgi:hypothetical protein
MIVLEAISRLSARAIRASAGRRALDAASPLPQCDFGVANLGIRLTNEHVRWCYGRGIAGRLRAPIRPAASRTR